MRERLKELQRILGVYVMIEKVCEAEAKRTSGEVRQTQQAIGKQTGAAGKAASEEREALACGDRLAWSYAAAQKKSASTRRARLERVLIEREERSTAARDKQMSSRQWSERMKQLVTGVQVGIAEQDDRREQAAADDLYLAKKSWKRK